MIPPLPSDDQNSSEAVERELSVHIFSVSAGLIGVCLTVIGLFRLIGGSSRIRGWADDFLAIDACAFMLSCLLAYLALRSRNRARRHRLERFADVIFLLGLAAMVVIGSLVAYELI
jgi:multisubunit Na+/H+ antiporter MnhF subunit